MSIVKYSSPQQIAASEKVFAEYTTAAGQNITSSDTIVDFGTKVVDTHNAVTVGAAWKFTAPRSGKAKVCASNTFQSESYTADQLITGFIYKGGSALYLLNAVKFQTSVTGVYALSSSCKEFYLSKGEYVDLRLANSATMSLLASEPYNAISISME